MEYYVKKISGELEEWNSEKLEIAIGKSSKRCEIPISDDEMAEVIALIETRVFTRSDNVIPVEILHTIVQDALREVRSDIAREYVNYRNIRKSWANTLEKLKEKTNSLLFLGDRDNANVDSSLASTIGCLVAEYMGTEMLQDFLLPAEKQAIRDGYIKVHDNGKRYWYSLNCCLFNVWKLLENGFEMANIWYNTPKSIDVAFDVISDTTLSAASQQYGGFTLYRVDENLSHYASLSYDTYYEKYIRAGLDSKIADSLAYDDVAADIRQGYQGWEYKFNTVASSRGDYPFITITLGLATDRWGSLIAKTILEVHKAGQGKKGFKKQTLFPKIVFLYDKNLHSKGKDFEYLYEEAISCSSVCAYPDYLSLTGEGYVASIYKKYGLVISPMGCRAFLSPWYEKGGMEPADENDVPVFEGRCNIGAVSLNLPLIYETSVRSGIDFFSYLDKYLEMIRNIHKRTYEWIANMPACRAPLHWCEGGLYGGNARYDEKIGLKRLRPMTASFGFTALNELQYCYNAKSIAQDGEFALEVLKYINTKVEEYKHEDGWLYAVYGTPAERLCGLQVEQFRKMYGIKIGVSDRDYVSNSFHCHVSEDITGIQKQDLEYRFWNYSNGGKIQYVRHLGYNVVGIRTIVDRAMEMGFYEGVNLSVCYCDSCGYQAFDIDDTCPRCGSHSLTKVDRMNGYLAYSRVRGKTRLNDAKMSEIKDRKSM